VSQAQEVVIRLSVLGG